MQFSSYFNRPERSDILLTINDGTTSATIYAHSQILGNRSGFFDGMLRYPDPAGAASTTESQPIKNYFLAIAEYGILEEFLDILEHSIYGCRPITYDQIQYQTNLLNFLLIDGVTYTKKYLDTTRFTIAQCSRSKKSVTLVDNTPSNGHLFFEYDSITNERKLTLDKYACQNIELLDYLGYLIPSLSVDLGDNPEELVKEHGLVINNLSDIQKIIHSLYDAKVILNNGFPYSNVLAKVIFDEGYEVNDPIYNRTKELAFIETDMEFDGSFPYASFRILKIPKSRLNVFIVIRNYTIDVVIHAKAVDIDADPTLYLVLDWIRIFLDLPSEIDMDAKDHESTKTIAKNYIDQRPKSDRQIAATMISYLYAANLLPSLKTPSTRTSENLFMISRDLGLIFDNEYSNTKMYDGSRLY